MKTLILLTGFNLLMPLVNAANRFADDAPHRFVHIVEIDENRPNEKFDTYISTSKIGIVTLHEEDAKFEVRVLTLTPAPGSVGGSMTYSIFFPDREKAAKCVARILEIMNQGELQNGAKSSN